MRNSSSTFTRHLIGARFEEIFDRRGQRKGRVLLLSIPRVETITEDEAQLPPAMGVAGKEFSLSSLRGQPVMLNFWATWCPPCQIEMPDIQKFFSRKGQDIKVLAVNLTVSENAPAQVRDFLNARGYTFPVMLDSKGDISQQYLVRSIPATFFIDQKGIIRDKHTGPMTLEMMEASLSKLK